MVFLLDFIRNEALAAAKTSGHGSMLRADLIMVPKVYPNPAGGYFTQYAHALEIKALPDNSKRLVSMADSRNGIWMDPYNLVQGPSAGR